MSRVIILVISVLTSFLFFNKSVYNYQITAKDATYTQYNEFDIYDVVAVDAEGNDLIDNVVVYGLELLNLEYGRITEFGSFNLRYTIQIDGEIVAHTYRKIKVIYKRDNLSGLIYNGDFLAGVNEWGVIDWQNSLKVSVKENKLIINQYSVDENIWDQSIYQYVENLELNKKYKLTFEVSSTYNKTIRVCLAQPLVSDPYSYNVMNEVNVEINNELNVYEIEFVCINPYNITNEFDFDINKVRLEFKFGKDNELNNECSTIIFDNINIKEI